MFLFVGRVVRLISQLYCEHFELTHGNAFRCIFFIQQQYHQQQQQQQYHRHRYNTTTTTTNNNTKKNICIFFMKINK